MPPAFVSSICSRHNVLPALRFVLLAGSALLFSSGCATTWNEKQLSKLSSVTVGVPSLAENAHHVPDAKDSPGYADSIPAVTGGGLIPALLGSAIDAAVTAKQQRQFEEEDGQHFEALRAAFTQSPGDELHKAMKQWLASDPFFGSRLAENAPAAVSMDVIRYGLAKSPLSTKDGILLRVRVVADVTLKDSASSSLLKAQLAGVASEAKSASDILADPEFFENGLSEAAEDLVHQFLTILDKKLGRPSPPLRALVAQAE